jgi:hypothetical protein
MTLIALASADGQIGSLVSGGYRWRSENQPLSVEAQERP